MGTYVGTNAGLGFCTLLMGIVYYIEYHCLKIKSQITEERNSSVRLNSKYSIH